MMAKSDVWGYVKTGGFWLTYAVLMGVICCLCFYGIEEQYYILTDYSYWRINFTVFPSFLTPPQPEMLEYIDVTFSLMCFFIPCIYNFYLIITKKEKKCGLVVILLVLLFMYFYGFFRCNFVTFCG